MLFEIFTLGYNLHNKYLRGRTPVEYDQEELRNEDSPGAAARAYHLSRRYSMIYKGGSNGVLQDRLALMKRMRGSTGSRGTPFNSYTRVVMGVNMIKKHSKRITDQAKAIIIPRWRVDLFKCYRKDGVDKNHLSLSDAEARQFLVMTRDFPIWDWAMRKAEDVVHHDARDFSTEKNAVRAAAGLYKTITFVAKTYEIHSYHSRDRRGRVQNGYITDQYLRDLDSTLANTPGSREELDEYTQLSNDDKRLCRTQVVEANCMDRFWFSVSGWIKMCPDLSKYIRRKWWSKERKWNDEMFDQRIDFNERLQLASFWLKKHVWFKALTRLLRLPNSDHKYIVYVQTSRPEGAAVRMA